MKENYEALKMEVINFDGEIWTEDGVGPYPDDIATSGEVNEIN